MKKLTSPLHSHKKSVITDPRTALTTLFFVLFLALLLRLWVSPSEGYGFDLGTNRGWSYSAVALGVGPSYSLQMKGSMLPNYPPFSMLLFHSTGWMYMKTVSPTLDIEALIFRTYMKLPAILADILAGAMLYLFVTHWKQNRWLGVAAAALYVFHPAPIHDGAIWGQTDGIYAMFMLGAFGTLVYGFSVIAGICMALALLTKMQAVACVPLFALIALRSGWRPTLKVLLGGILATLIVLIPFVATGTLQDVLDVYTSSVGFYNSVSSSAYNFWWAMYGDAAGSMHDTDFLIGALTFRTAGLILFVFSALCPLIVLWPSLKASPKNGATLPHVFFAATFTMYAFFLWNTQMHERYSFTVVTLGVIVAFINIRGAALYLLITGLITMNLYGWLPAGILDKALYDTFPMLDVFIASALVILFFLFAGPSSGLLKLTKRARE